MRILRLFAIFAILVLALSACGNDDDNRNEQYSESPCIPPYACGPMYVNYVPVFYQMHPYSLYFSPYQSSYNYSYNNGRRVVTSRTSQPQVARDSRIKWVSPSKTNTGASTNTGTKSQTTTGNKSTSKTSTTTKTAPKTTTSGKR